MRTQGNICKLLPVAQYSLRYQGSRSVVAGTRISLKRYSIIRPRGEDQTPTPRTHNTTVQEGSNKLTLFKMCKQGEI